MIWGQTLDVDLPASVQVFITILCALVAIGIAIFIPFVGTNTYLTDDDASPENGLE